MRLVSFLLVLGFVSCQLTPNLKDEVPKNLIQEDKFSLILEELMILEHQIQTDYPQLVQFKLIIKKNSKLLFKKYHISENQFDISFEYYASDQLKMKQIYANILESMTRKMTNLELKKKIE